MKKAVICEFGDSHDDILYGQFEFLKKTGYTTYFVGNKLLKPRLQEYDNVDQILYLDFSKGQISNLYQIIKTWLFIYKNGIDDIILNTIEGTPVRNFCLLPWGRKNITGIIHNAGNLISNSTTFNKIIKPKIKKMYTLNNYIWKNVGDGLDIANEFVYPLRFPHFKSVVTKPDGEFWVVIPGLVESDRRDYFHLIEALKSKSIPKGIKFILLGKSMHKKGLGPQIKELIESYSLQKYFITFDDYVDNDTFRSYLNEADILATLIHPGISNFDNYSTNKTSGTFLLSYAHLLPMLNHEYFMNYEDINISSVFYNLNNLVETILNLYTNKNIILDIKKQMETNANLDFETNRAKYISLLSKVS